MTHGKIYDLAVEIQGLYTGCGVSTGTTFVASTNPMDGLTKLLFYA